MLFYQSEANFSYQQDRILHDDFYQLLITVAVKPTLFYSLVRLCSEPYAIGISGLCPLSALSVREKTFRGWLWAEEATKKVIKHRWSDKKPLQLQKDLITHPRICVCCDLSLICSSEVFILFSHAEKQKLLLFNILQYDLF